MRRNPINQLHSRLGDVMESLVRAVGKIDSTDNLLWHLRRMPKGKFLDTLHKSTKGRNNLPVQQIADVLYQIPKFSLCEANVSHTLDKVTGKSRGKLSIVIDLERTGNKGRNKKRSGGGDKDDGVYATLTIVVGSFEQRLLLACSEISVSRTGSWSASKDIEFDWDVAQADGGEGSGSIIIRLQLDTVHGMDSESVVTLR